MGLRNPLAIVVGSSLRFVLLLAGFTIASSQVATATVTNVVWYRLGESDPGAAAGIVATNTLSETNSFNLRLTNGPRYSADVAPGSGSALSMQFSANQWGTNAPLNFVDNFGLELWVKSTNLTGNSILAYNGNTANNGWGLFRQGTNYQALFGGQVIFGTGIAFSNVWTHLALVRDSGTSTLYVNGVVAGTSPSSPAALAGSFGLGGPPQAPTTDFLNGLLDEVRVFTFAPGQFSTEDLFLNRHPVVITTGPTMQFTNTATLNGTVNPGGPAAMAWFEWGTSANNYTQQTAPLAMGIGTVALTFSNTLSGLTPGIIYHYRAVGSNAAGAVRGRDVPFGSPAIVLNSAALFTNECHSAFTDPAAAVDAPLAVAGGSYYTLVLRSDGTIVGWGSTGFGQETVPVGLSNVVAIAAGESHSLALRSDGTVAAWGYNAYGQTNVPVGLSNVVTIAGGGYHSLAVRSDGTIAAWGENNLGQTNVPVGLSNVVAIAAGTYHSMALRSDGTIVAWGFNFYGQTNVPVGLSNAAAIAAAGLYSVALRRDGTVAAWGDNTYGQTNVPVALSNVVAIAAGGFQNLALRSDGTVAAWGDNSYGQTNVPVGLSNVVAIATGGYHCLALRSDGTIAAWGENNFGQTNIPAGVSSLALKVSGSVNTNLPGSYLLSYTSTNSLGGIGLATRTVIVADRLGPVITMLGANPILITNAANLPFVDPGSTALDLCEGTSSSVAVSNTVNVKFPGTYAITYRSADSTGNFRLATRTVIVALPPAVPGDQDGDGLVTQSELDAVYARYVTNSPWLYMTNVAGLGATNVTFALSNSVVGNYSVEVSTNLATWQLLGPATPRFLFTDTNAPDSQQRYYRLRWP